MIWQAIIPAPVSNSALPAQSAKKGAPITSLLARLGGESLVPVTAFKPGAGRRSTGGEKKYLFPFFLFVPCCPPDSRDTGRDNGTPPKGGCPLLSPFPAGQCPANVPLCPDVPFDLFRCGIFRQSSGINLPVDVRPRGIPPQAWPEKTLPTTDGATCH